MKSQFRKEFRYFPRGRGDNDFVFVHRGPNYHRRIKTFPEVRQNCGDENEYRGTNMHGIRPCRSNTYLNAWMDGRICRNYGKSWKDFTKYPKQWMDKSEPVPSKWE